MVGFTLIEMYSYQGEKDLGELTSRVRKLQTDGYKNRRGKREEVGNLNRDIMTMVSQCPTPVWRGESGPEFKMPADINLNDEVPPQWAFLMSQPRNEWHSE